MATDDDVISAREEELAAALDAAAETIRPSALRPIVMPERKRSARWRAWAAPLAAAASVVFVVSLVIAVTGGPRHVTGNAGEPAGTGVTTANMPGYFAFFQMPDEHEFLWDAVVLSTSTGAEIARTPVLDNTSANPVSIAAAPDDRTFYADYRLGSQTLIYTFSIPVHGRTAPMRRIAVVNNTGYPAYLTTSGNQLAVSPDGTELALTVDSSGPATEHMADKIVVINVQTGAQSTWQGGLDRLGRAFGIVNLSWAAGGRSLVFLAEWCDYFVSPALVNYTGYCSGANTPYGYRDAQIRSLNVTTGGGSLDSGSVLLRQSARYPAIAQAIAGPDGTGITAVVLSGPVTVSGTWHDLAIDQISADGSVRGVDYRSSHLESAVSLPHIMLNWDPSGRYLILYDASQPLFAWVSQGALHPLPFPSPVRATRGFWWSGGPVAW